MKVCIYEYYLFIRFMIRIVKYEIFVNNIRDSVIFFFSNILFNVIIYIRVGIFIRFEIKIFRWRFSVRLLVLKFNL